MGQQAADPGQKQYQGSHYRHGGVNGVLKGGGRRIAKNHVPNDAAAHGGGEPQNAHAEEVHVLPQARHGPGGGEGENPHQLDD